MKSHLCLVVLLSGCGAQQGSSPPAGPKAVEPYQAESIHAASLSEDDIVAGETIYIPVYSHIFHLNETRAFNLTATLSVRNTDLERPIVLTSVRYYDSDGKMLREYVPGPTEVGPVATVSYVVEQEDSAGGAGANFIVEWVATARVSSPLAEAVMIRASNQQGISFVSRGVVVARRGESLP